MGIPPRSRRQFLHAAFGGLALSKLVPPLTNATWGETPSPSERFVLNLGSPAAAVALSPDSQMVAGGPDARIEPTLKIWNTRTGKELAACKGHAGGLRRLGFTTPALSPRWQLHLTEKR